LPDTVANPEISKGEAPIRTPRMSCEILRGVPNGRGTLERGEGERDGKNCINFWVSNLEFY
jgi:hypothetical protein